MRNFFGLLWTLTCVALGFLAWDTAAEMIAEASGTPAYFKPTSTDRRVYVAVVKGYQPPAGAPVFYAPFPSTLCMLGEGNEENTRVIYEARKGACDQAVKGYREAAHQIKLPISLGDR